MLLLSRFCTIMFDEACVSYELTAILDERDMGAGEGLLCCEFPTARGDCRALPLLGMLFWLKGKFFVILFLTE